MPPRWLATPSHRYHITYVNLHDTNFAPYQAYTVNHALHDALVSKDPNKFYQNNQLWHAISLDKEMLIPIVDALLDGRGVEVTPGRSQLSSNGWKIDPQKQKNS